MRGVQRVNVAKGAGVVRAVAFNAGTIIQRRGTITSDSAANVAASIPSIVRPYPPPQEYRIYRSRCGYHTIQPLLIFYILHTIIEYPYL